MGCSQFRLENGIRIDGKVTLGHNVVANGDIYTESAVLYHTGETKQGGHYFEANGCFINNDSASTKGPYPEEKEDTSIRCVVYIRKEVEVIQQVPVTVPAENNGTNKL